jgi:hypothetical protein
MRRDRRPSWTISLILWKAFGKLQGLETSEKRPRAIYLTKLYCKSYDSSFGVVIIRPGCHTACSCDFMIGIHGLCATVLEPWNEPAT